MYYVLSTLTLDEEIPGELFQSGRCDFVLNGVTKNITVDVALHPSIMFPIQTCFSRNQFVCEHTDGTICKAEATTKRDGTLSLLSYHNYRSPNQKEVKEFRFV